MLGARHCRQGGHPWGHDAPSASTNTQRTCIAHTTHNKGAPDKALTSLKSVFLMPGFGPSPSWPSPLLPQAHTSPVAVAAVWWAAWAAEQAQHSTHLACPTAVSGHALLPQAAAMQLACQKAHCCSRPPSHSLPKQSVWLSEADTARIKSGRITSMGSCMPGCARAWFLPSWVLAQRAQGGGVHEGGTCGAGCRHAATIAPAAVAAQSWIVCAPLRSLWHMVQLALGMRRGGGATRGRNMHRHARPACAPHQRREVAPSPRRTTTYFWSSLWPN